VVSLLLTSAASMGIGVEQKALRVLANWRAIISCLAAADDDDDRAVDGAEPDERPRLLGRGVAMARNRQDSLAMASVQR